MTGRLLRWALYSSVIFYILPTFGQVAANTRGPEHLAGKTFTAQVIRILDGDTMEVLFNDRPVRIRLSHIDCPEVRKSQPFSSRAKQALSALCYAQLVVVHAEDYDFYGRLLAVVENEQKQIVNQELVRQGMAWHYKRYSSDVKYADLEIQAREHRVGLWKDPDPVAPWEWRKPRKMVSQKATVTEENTKQR